MDTTEVPNLDGVFLADSASFFLLDSSYKLKVLKYENSKKHTSVVSLINTSTVDLADFKIKRLFRSLEYIPWQKLVVSKTAILCCRLHVNNSEGV